MMLPLVICYILDTELGTYVLSYNPSQQCLELDVSVTEY